MTLLEKLNQLPPAFCRYVARDEQGRRGLTTQELHEKSGLCTTTVKDLSFRLTWANVTVATAQAFMAACGVNPLAARKHREFVRRRAMVHVRDASPAQQRMYSKIEKLLVEAAQKRNTKIV